MAIALFAASCAEQAQRPPRRELPRLGELQTSDTPPPPDTLLRGPVARLRITRLDLPFNESLDEARLMLEQQGIAPPIAPLWLDNGMFVRVVSKDALDAILDAVPTPASAYRTIMSASNIPMPLDYELTIRREQQCVVARPDGGYERLTFTGGRCRFLIEAVPQDDGTAVVSITPQHHQQKVSIVPRSVLEKQLDGRIFETLQLQVRLEADEFLVILPTIEQPAPPPAPTSQPAGSEDESDTETIEQPLPEPIDPIGDLGRLLLHASRYEQPLRLFVVVGLEQRDR